MQNRNMRLSIAGIGVLLIAVVAIIAGWTYLQGRADRPGPTHKVTESGASEFVVVKLKGVTFTIPKQYLGTPFGYDREGFWMLLPLPGETPAMKDQKYVPELRVNLDAKWPGPGAVSRHYTIPKSIGEPFEPPAKGPYGLTIERAIPKKGKPKRRTVDDLYTYGTLSDPESFFSFQCQSDIVTEGRTEGPFSSQVGLCKMGFLYRDFRVDVGFPKSRLADWRNIHAHVKELLDQLSEGGNNND